MSLITCTTPIPTLEIDIFKTTTAPTVTPQLPTIQANKLSKYFFAKDGIFQISENNFHKHEQTP